jgi:hypothetical protein
MNTIQRLYETSLFFVKDGACRVCKHGISKELVEYLIEDYRELATLPRSHTSQSSQIPPGQVISERLARFNIDLVVNACADHHHFLVSLASYLRWWIVYEDDIPDYATFTSCADRHCASCIAHMVHMTEEGDLIVEKRCEDCRFLAVCQSVQLQAAYQLLAEGLPRRDKDLKVEKRCEDCRFLAVCQSVQLQAAYQLLAEGLPRRGKDLIYSEMDLAQHIVILVGITENIASPDTLQELIPKVTSYGF